MNEEEAKALKDRVSKIEAWIDLWETYDSGWTEYRQQKKDE